MSANNPQSSGPTNLDQYLRMRLPGLAADGLMTREEERNILAELERGAGLSPSTCERLAQIFQKDAQREAEERREGADALVSLQGALDQAAARRGEREKVVVDRAVGHIRLVEEEARKVSKETERFFADIERQDEEAEYEDLLRKTKQGSQPSEGKKAA